MTVERWAPTTRPVRLREHPARREAGHPAAAQQLRVLQRREVQPPDDGRLAPHGSRRGTAYAALDGALMREPAVGAARQLERPVLPPPASAASRSTRPTARGRSSTWSASRHASWRDGPRRPSPLDTRGPTCSSTSYGDSLWAGVLFIGVTLITVFQLPADPARLAAGKSATAEDVERVAHQLGSTGRSTSSTGSS